MNMTIITAFIFIVSFTILPMIYLLYPTKTKKILLSRKFYTTMILSILIFGGGFGLALTQVSWNNSSTIAAGQDIFITQPTFTVFTNCPADGDAQYVNTGFATLSWTLVQGG